MKKFAYFEPKTIPEACSILAKYGKASKVLAGGTDLLVRMKQGTIAPRCVVNIKTIAGLNGIQRGEKGELQIGALTLIHALERSFSADRQFESIGRAAFLLGSPQIRNVATIGGNLCNAAPSADMAPPLIALGATLEIAGPTGSRTLALEDFFTGPGSTALTDSEMLTQIRVPEPPSGSGSWYEKIGRIKLVDLAVVGVAAWIRLKLDREKAVFDSARIVLGAVAPTPMRARRAESVLMKKTVDDGIIEKASQAASEEARPISDVRASDAYRRQMVKVLTARALRSALERAKKACDES